MKYKKALRLSAVLGIISLMSLPLHTQVTIGSGKNPVKGALLDLKQSDTNGGSTNATKGLMLPRVTLTDLNDITTGDITGVTAANKDAHIGLTVYNLTQCDGKFAQGVYTWTGTEWLQLTKNPLPAIPAVTLTSSSLTPGTAILGEDVTYTVSVTANPAPGNVTWTITGAEVLDNGGQPGDTQVKVKYNLNGTASVIAEVSNACGTASATDNVAIIPAVAGSGVFTGKTCFDIVEGNFNPEGGYANVRNYQKTNFSDPAVQDPKDMNFKAPYSGSQVYTFTPDGDVSNVRFAWVDDASFTSILSMTPQDDYSGDIQPGQECKTLVVYKPTMNEDLVDYTRDMALKPKLYAIYNDQINNQGTDQYVELTVNLQDGSCCGAYISATEWRAFMCHNLGDEDDYSLDPFTPAKGLNGYYYQWGRKDPVGDADGLFVDTWDTTYAPDGSWSPNTKTENDPCPAGYRVPTSTQWTGVSYNNAGNLLGSWGGNAYENGMNYGSFLYLPLSGMRTYDQGDLQYAESRANYWTSNVDGSGARSFYVNGYPIYIVGTTYTTGFSVRCIAY
jgi:uncharacterized protein (TIGR02145 family)